MYLKTDLELINLDCYKSIYEGESEENGKTLYWVLGDDVQGNTDALISCDSEKTAISLIEEITNAVLESKRMFVVEGE